jgi:hypothetical protein
MSWASKWVVLLAVGLTTGCGWFSENAEELNCDGVRLGQTSASLMAWVGFRLQGHDKTDVLASVWVDGEEPYPTLVAADEEGNLWLQVPLHPAGVEGGEVDIKVEHEQVSCPAATLRDGRHGKREGRVRFHPLRDAIPSRLHASGPVPYRRHAAAHGRVPGRLGLEQLHPLFVRFG